MEDKDGKRSRLLYSLKDFQLALSAYAFLAECDFDAPISRVNLRRFTCYETTMIISYVRPFSAAHGDVKRLKFEDAGIVLNTEQLALHEHLICLRNKVFAHSDGAQMRFLAKPLKIEMAEDFKFQTFQTVFDEGLNFSSSSSLDVAELISVAFHGVCATLHEGFQQESEWVEFRRDCLGL
jgi:hypothetical protein